MREQSFVDRRGEPIAVAPEDLRRLRESLEGTSLVSGEPGYEEARAIWNAMIDRRPALIAACADAADVARGVDFARETGVALTVRGGGHNIGGRAVADGALMIDLSGRRDVVVDAEREIAVVGPGATLGDLDAGTRPQGRVVPSGIVSETGVAGLTLGGGFGWLSRRWGLTCDHLVGVEMVAADGRVVVADDESDPELMWGLRGGGGGFGVVTSFRFRTRRLDDPVAAGMLVFPTDARADAATRFRARTADAPEELTCMLKLGAAPAAPFLPEDLHGRPAAFLLACHSGAAADAEADLAPLRDGSPAVADLIAPRPFAAFQSMFDAGEVRGRRDYWKSEYVSDLDDGLAADLLAATTELPSASANVKVFHLGGAVARVSPAATAAAHRDAKYIVVIASAWDDPADDAANVAWVRETWRKVHARSGRGGYVNFLTEDATESEHAASHGGVDLARLERLRRRWDPDGLFAPIAPRREEE